MAGKVRDTDHEESSGLDLLHEPLVDYLGAQVGHLAGVGGRMLQSDSPLKAFVGQKAKGLKDNVMGKVKGISGGGGGGKAGSTKVVNIIEVLDVGVPIRTAYNYWTQYE